MSFPPVTFADWRAQVEKDLRGASFEKVLVHRTAEGLSVAPLYTELPKGMLAPPVEARGFRICLRHPVEQDESESSWVARTHALAARTGGLLVVETDAAGAAEVVSAQLSSAPFVLDCDPLRDRARDPRRSLAADLDALAKTARDVDARAPGSTSVMVSTLAYHDAGADAADELAIALSTGAKYLAVLAASGLPIDNAAAQIAFQVAVGRDTFSELAKLRALRTCWQKVLVASGAQALPKTLVHAVCSSRTLAVRDPWVNMLRVTTQMFAAILGGADLVTPATFDQLGGEVSSLGARVARNTGLVLREESFLGKVADPAGGSYYLESMTDALAREGWTRFRALEGEGGIVPALESGRLLAKLEATWSARLDAIAKRKVPILGVSEFANLGEALPSSLLASSSERPPKSPSALPVHRDAEAFEALRTLAERRSKPLEAVLVTLGPLAESRARVGFATGLFAAGGIPSRESTDDEKAPLVCLCGADERYATEAVDRVRALVALGCDRVLLAGRPGALEAPLREAGLSGFVFAGCDAVAILTELLEARAEGSS